MKPIRIRRLNDEGIRRMEEFIQSLKTETPQTTEQAHALLTDPETSASLPNSVEVDRDRRFSRRFELAEYLHQTVPRTGVRDFTKDKGLWSWLTLLWFDQVCIAKKAGGVRKPGEMHRYIPELDNFRTYYRHLLLGPFVIYGLHEDEPQRALCMLCQSPSIHPDTAEQLASRQDMIQSPAIIATANAFYYDASKRDIRKGATSYFRTGGGSIGRPGTVRRLVDLAMQFDRTYDHLACTASAFATLLPDEFERFVPRGRA